jgi:hypothetical protein
LGSPSRDIGQMIVIAHKARKVVEGGGRRAVTV